VFEFKLLHISNLNYHNGLRRTLISKTDED